LVSAPFRIPPMPLSRLSLAALLWLLALSSGFPQAPEGNGPVEGLMKYRHALLSADGKAAWKCVDSQTQEFYTQALKDALSAPKSKVEAMDFIPRFTVLRCRVEFSKEKLQAMTGEDMFVTAVDRQWISRASVTKMDNMVVAKNDGKKAVLALAQQPSVPAFHLVLEDGGWKVDLTAIFDLGNKAMQHMAKDAGKTENEFIFDTLRRLTRLEFDDAVWDRPMR
jgi:hypothetical protein